MVGEVGFFVLDYHNYEKTEVKGCFYFHWVHTRAFMLASASVSELSYQVVLVNYRLTFLSISSTEA